MTITAFLVNDVTTPATILEPGRHPVHLSSTSPVYSRTATIQVTQRITVAALELQLTDQFGQPVQITGKAS